ncbi:MAG: DUF805 domain-containing protein [Gemmatimonadetes bacterium]|nr:DUF805 domain-containing protein [Gemmatimonadota bacterium]MYI07742.1 DUF805 domain-containing protein [Gemmatimonadota bacterium]
MDDLVELFTFEGRANRSHYWLIKVVGGIVFAVYALIFAGLTDAFGPIFILPMLGFLWTGAWAGLAATVKRLHDLNRPGWHFFLLGIPIYNLYLWFLLLCRGGTVGPNMYGPDPLARRYRYRIEG